jgi:hypothetical protein
LRLRSKGFERLSWHSLEPNCRYALPEFGKQVAVDIVAVGKKIERRGKSLREGCKSFVGLIVATGFAVDRCCDDKAEEVVAR